MHRTFRTGAPALALALLGSTGCQSAEAESQSERPVRRLHNLSPEHQRAALSALAVNPDPTMFAEVAACLKSRDSIVRHQAATLLGEQRVRAAVPDLIALLDDEAGFVREGAYIALRKITAQSIDYDPYARDVARASGARAWAVWWQAHGAAFSSAEVHVGPPR